ncbi:hypothetical protein THAOC_28111 [Thalassiosira oceanica]|uniref:Uncharacterized protein n=1 Tax=Thalassiosira oceanica TaxID=159749 RepID=K0RH76_THAOC|nr:hypothetical protein THAOC_28111 [Thalassiosira oceanica]|eukprot:EJK52595.1 hypothetical protein THAOC_28111 [Thalassiosira oceanica]
MAPTSPKIESSQIGHMTAEENPVLKRSHPPDAAICPLTYERLAMLSCLLRKVYVDEEWVAQEYLRRCKAGAWKSEQDEESLKCWNLERIIESELIGAPVPVDLTMEEFVEVDDASIQVIE